MDFVPLLAFASAAFDADNSFFAPARSLGNNALTNLGRDMSGILKLAEALPHSQLTSLRWPTSPLNFAWTLCLCLPLRQQPLTRLFPSSCLLLSQSSRQRDGPQGLCGDCRGPEGQHDSAQPRVSLRLRTFSPYASQLESFPTVNSL